MPGVNLIVHFADQLLVQIDEIDLVMLESFLKVFYCDGFSVRQRCFVCIWADEWNEGRVVFPPPQTVRNLCGYFGKLLEFYFHCVSRSVTKKGCSTMPVYRVDV